MKTLIIVIVIIVALLAAYFSFFSDRSQSADDGKKRGPKNTVTQAEDRLSEEPESGNPDRGRGEYNPVVATRGKGNPISVASGRDNNRPGAVSVSPATVPIKMGSTTVNIPVVTSKPLIKGRFPVMKSDVVAPVKPNPVLSSISS